VAVAVDVAVGVGMAVAVVVVCSSVVAPWVLSTIVVELLLVRSVRAGDSDASAGVPVRSSKSNAESNVERVMAATIAPRSTTGASAAVKGSSAHGESPAWVPLRTR
jgi:hypothetical protein